MSREELEREEKSAYYDLVAERRGDNSRGRVLPSRVERAQRRWYDALEALELLEEVKPDA